MDNVIQFINTNHGDKIVAEERSIAVGIQLVLRPKPPEDPGAAFEPNPYIALITDETRPRNLVTFPIDLDDTSLESPVSPTDEPPYLPPVPASPDHLNLQVLSETDAPQIDLPFRSTQFNQGLMAVQYESLPFYYTHKLLLIAQAANVVSSITEVEHKDFEYVTPEIVGTMEGVEGADGTRYRRIAIPLGRFWDALPPGAKSEWGIEDPKTLETPPPPSVPPFVGDPLKRRPASVIDPAVVYTIVITRGDSGNVEAIADYRFDEDELTGFESRNLPVPFRGEAVRIHTYSPDSIEAVHKQLELETILVSTNSAPGFEESVQAVSSRHAFTASTFEALRRWPVTRPLKPGEDPIDGLMFPRTSRLRWHFGPGPDDNLNDAEVDALRALAADCDPSYSEPLLQLLSAKSVRRTPQIGAERVAEACVGLEQLREIHDHVDVTPKFVPGQGTSAPVPGAIQWIGFLSEEQKLVLEEWQQTSLLQQTFERLIVALTETRLFSGDMTAGTVDDALLITHHLEQRIDVVAVVGTGKERLEWKKALTQPPSDTEPADLQNLLNAVPAGEQPAVQILVDEVNSVAVRETQVSIAESFWRARPDQQSLSAYDKLKHKLLLGNGVVGFTGLMTLEEGKKLRKLVTAKPDKASVVALFIAVANSGLGGGELRLVVRRGAAAPYYKKIFGELKLV